MIKYGTVSSIFPDKGTVKVTFEDLNIPSAEIPVLQGRTYQTKKYSLPKIGETGICIFPENSFNGFYLGSGYNTQDTIPTNAKEGVEVTLYSDGTIISYDENTSKLYINATKQIEIVAKDIRITADNTTITSPITINGDTNINGLVKVSQDVVAQGISLVSHVHGGITGGPSDTGGPK